MENASKALIIAGAILLSILIIGLGMTVFNSADNVKGAANLDATELRAHNSQFLSYEGRQKGSQVRALVNSIKTNNATYNDRMIAIGFSTNTTPGSPEEIDLSEDNEDPNDYSSYQIKNNTTYFVTFGYGANNCINSVEIHVYSDADLSGGNTATE